MSDDRVRIRGTSEGLVITLGPGDLETLLRELDERLSNTASFFRGGRVALQVGPRELTTEDLEAIGYTISRNGVSLWAIIGDSAATQAAAEALGLETSAGFQVVPSRREPRPETSSSDFELSHGAETWDEEPALSRSPELHPERSRRGSEGSVEGPALSRVEGPAPSRVEGPALSRVEGPALSRVEGPALSRVEGPPETQFKDAAPRLAQDMDLGVLVRRTLRSGQVVQHPGHVVVIGDVNPGAEIIAGGDVVVWGKLRGVVHAGATGDDRAMVCALSLAPLQLRIGHHIARAPEGREGLAERPEMASVQDDEIVAEPWEK